MDPRSPQESTMTTTPGAMRAVVLLSGGLDSATTLAMARAEGLEAHALSVRYGQRHAAELEAARQVAASLGAARHLVVDVNLAAFGGSALTDAAIAVPKHRDERAIGEGVPVTYVPARNTVLLALALGAAEVLDARHIFVGVNALDYSGYPDCRPEFLAAFQALARVATKAGVEDRAPEIRAPLVHLSKAEIIRAGTALGVDYALTVSCYDPDARGRACGGCDACLLRRRGFAEAGLADPTRYQR
jgi:7-cyano-7-deazaguanine synthase